jgi:hypothetical protein
MFQVQVQSINYISLAVIANFENYKIYSHARYEGSLDFSFSICKKKKN